MTKVKDSIPLEVLTLSLDGQPFAIEAAHVREILDLAPVTEVPTSKPFVNGLINVRGKVAPLADLRHKFGMELKPSTIDTRIVVVEIDIEGEQTTVGLLADKVYEVTTLSAAAQEETPRIGMTWRHEYIRCIGKSGDDFIVVLDIEAIFAPTKREKAEFSVEHAAARPAA